MVTDLTAIRVSVEELAEQQRRAQEEEDDDKERARTREENRLKRQADRDAREAKRAARAAELAEQKLALADEEPDTECVQLLPRAKTTPDQPSPNTKQEDNDTLLLSSLVSPMKPSSPKLAKPDSSPRSVPAPAPAPAPVYSLAPVSSLAPTPQVMGNTPGVHNLGGRPLNTQADLRAAIDACDPPWLKEAKQKEKNGEGASSKSRCCKLCLIDTVCLVCCLTNKERLSLLHCSGSSTCCRLFLCPCPCVLRPVCRDLNVRRSYLLCGCLPFPCQIAVCCPCMLCNMLYEY